MKELVKAWGPVMHEAAAARMLKKDMKLKSGDVIPKGTAVIDVKFYGATEPDYNRYTFCSVFFDFTSPAKNFRVTPMRMRIQALPEFVTGFKVPSMSQMERMEDNAAWSTPTGKRVEADGYGPDGSPSWALVLGYV